MSSWDRCLSSFDYRDHPGPPLQFPEDELQLSGCSPWQQGRGWAEFLAYLCLSSLLPQPVTDLPAGGRGKKHCSQHFSEGETTERSLEGKLAMMRLGLLWECCVSVWSCHQFSQISDCCFWKGHKCSEGFQSEDWDTAKLWVKVASQDDLIQPTESLWGEQVKTGTKQISGLPNLFKTQN